MNIIAVDDEVGALWCIEQTFKKAVPDCELKTFTKPREALEYAQSYPVDVAFLDVEMCGMTGVDLALRLKEQNSRLNIIFVTCYTDYTGTPLSFARRAIYCSLLA